MQIKNTLHLLIEATKIAASAFIISSCTETPDDPIIPSVVSCKAEGEVGCVARADFPAFDKNAMTTKGTSIKTGVTLAGIAGTLGTCTVDNGVGCITTADFPSVNKAELTAGTVASGTTVAGVAGAYAPPCTADAQPSCLSTATFRAVNLSTLSPWDVRLGKTFAGVVGTSTFYQNAANLVEFNYTVGSGSNASTSVADFYDSIDDDANGAGVPSLLATGAPEIQSNWVRESSTDTDGDQTCNGIEPCVYQDLFTGLSWHEDNTTAYLWSAAITYCEGLTAGTKTAWRLPTQKELMQAYINRIWTLEATLALDASNEYYTASAVSVSGLTNLAWAVQLPYGNVTTQDKSADSNRILCVHQ